MCPVLNFKTTKCFMPHENDPQVPEKKIEKILAEHEVYLEHSAQVS